jgi:hypothetical protein
LLAYATFFLGRKQAQKSVRELKNTAYRLMLLSRRALAITDTELKLIAALANIGLSSNPNTG